MLPNESEIGHFAGFQLQLELVSDKGDEFGIGRFSLTFRMNVDRLNANRGLLVRATV